MPEPDAAMVQRVLDALEAGVCPVCQSKIRQGMFMCRDDWREVPELLKKELRAAVKGPWAPWCDSAIACIEAVEPS